jgi:LCP family protein required for cell wall assembly
MTFKKKKLSHYESAKTGILGENGTDVAKKYLAYKAKNTVVFFVLVSLLSLFIGFVGFVALAQVSGVKLELVLPTIVTKTLPFLKAEASKPEKLNILLTGVGGAGHEGTDLTDTIILASVNRRTKTVSMLSLPRDLYVEIPTSRGNSYGKVNEIYQRNLKNSTPELAMKSLADKVTEITGEPVDKYLNIDFSGFKKFVDVLGGVEIDVPEDLVDFEYPDENWGYQTFRIKKGFQALSGDTALKYVRSRHSTSDFDRSVRQQLVLRAIKDKLFSIDALTSPTKLSTLYSTVTGHIKTDLQFDEIIELAFFAKDLKSSNMLSFNLNDGCFQSVSFCQVGGFLYTPLREQFGGMSVLLTEGATATNVSEYSVIRKFANFIYNYPELFLENQEITLVNATKYTGLANNLAMELKKYGFNVPEKKSISSTKDTIAQSEIRHVWNAEALIGVAPDSATLRALQLYLGLPARAESAVKYTELVGPQIEIILGTDAKSVLP